MVAGGQELCDPINLYEIIRVGIGQPAVGIKCWRSRGRRWRRAVQAVQQAKGCDARHIAYRKFVKQHTLGMTGGERAATKRPASQGGGEEEKPNYCDQAKGRLDSLAAQIEHFEALAEEQEAQPPAAKKPSKLHSLTQNTTHRKIRCSGRVWTPGAASMLRQARAGPSPPWRPPLPTAGCAPARVRCPHRAFAGW